MAQQVEEFLIRYTEDTSAFGRIQQAAEQTNSELSRFGKEQKRYFDSVGGSAEDYAKKIALIADAQAEANRIGKLSNQILSNEAGSYNALTAELELVNTALKRFSAQQLQTSKEGQALLKRQEQLTEQLSEWQKAAKGAEKAGDGYLSSLSDMPGAAGAAGGAVEDLSGKFKALLRNPVVLVIAAIVGALATLGRAFFGTEKGARVLEKGMNAIEGVMLVLGEVTTQVAEGFEQLFSGGIKEGLKEVGDIILRNITNRLKAIPAALGAIGDTLLNLVKLDFEAAKESAGQVGEAFVQGFTGFTGEEQQAALALFEQLAENADGYRVSLDNLSARTRELARANVELTKTAERYATAEAVAQAAASDTTLGFQAQKKAVEELQAAQEGRIRAELRIAQNNLSLVNQRLAIERQAGKDITGLLQEQGAALAEVERGQRDLTLATIEGARARREITRDEFERELDFAVDFYDAQKTQLERAVADEVNTLEQREAALARLRELDSSAFAEQLSLLEDFTGKKLDLQELSLEQDEKVVRERLRQADLDDVTLGRILEVLRERKIATQDILDAERELSKAKSEAAAKEQEERQAFLEQLRETAGAEFEQQQELEAARFDLTRRSATQRARFELEQEREKLKKILELNEQFQDGLTEVQIETIKAQIEGIDNNLKEFDNIIERVKQAIFDGLGFDEQQARAVFAGFETAFNNIVESRAALIEAEIANQDRLIDALEGRIDEQQDLLDREFELKKLGLANNYEAERESLAAIQAERDAAEAKRAELEEKARKRQAAIETAQQISSLITATANIFRATSGIIPPIGQIIAGAAIAAMFASFAAAKVNARKAAQRELGEGGDLSTVFSGEVKGEKHNPKGQPQRGVQAFTKTGRSLLLEGDEFVVRSSFAKENRPFLHSLNSGEYKGHDLAELVRIGAMMQEGKVVTLDVPEVPDFLGPAAKRLEKSERGYTKAKVKADKENIAAALAGHFAGLSGQMGSVAKAIKEKPSYVPNTPDGFIEFKEVGNKKITNIKKVRPK